MEAISNGCLSDEDEKKRRRAMREGTVPVPSRRRMGDFFGCVMVVDLLVVLRLFVRDNGSILNYRAGKR